MKIGVCIPGYVEHLRFLPRCIDSIFAQTRLPDVISISISSMPADMLLPPIDETIVKVKVTRTSEVQNAAKNRNIAAAAIVDEVDVISFFDMDDLMHPHRIESMFNVFRSVPGAGVVLHQWIAFGDDRPLEFPTSGGRSYKNCFRSERDAVCGRVHVIREAIETPTGGHANGWVTLRAQMWKEVRYPEHYSNGEDSEYVWRLYMLWPDSFVYCTDYLGAYYRR